MILALFRSIRHVLRSVIGPVLALPRISRARRTKHMILCFVGPHGRLDYEMEVVSCDVMGDGASFDTATSQRADPT